MRCRLRRRDVLAVRLHLGRQGLRARARLVPGLPEEARLDLDDAPGHGGARGAAARRRRRVRRRRSRRTTGASPRRGSRDRPVRDGRVRERAPDAALALDARGSRRTVRDALDELVTMRSRDVELGPAVHREAEIDLFEAPGEELAALRAAGDDRRLLAPGRRDVRRRRPDSRRCVCVRFRHGDRIATGVGSIGGSDGDIQVLRGTFFEDPLPTGERSRSTTSGCSRRCCRRRSCASAGTTPRTPRSSAWRCPRSRCCS